MNIHSGQAMSIVQKRVRNVEGYLSHLPPGQRFRVVCAVANPAVLVRLGLSETPQDGDTILPSIVGAVSRYNAEGRWIVHRDLPKERRYVNTIWWTHVEWHGPDREEVEESVDIERECFQRELSPPPAVSLTHSARGGVRQICSPVLCSRPEEYNSIKHVINLFLELFGCCTLLPEGFPGAIQSVSVQRVNWKLLPPGQYPWDRVSEHVASVMKNRSEGTAKVILERQEVLQTLGPDEVHVGAGGFRDYIAYVFRVRGIVVLESVLRDNAMYVFGKEWRQFSQLSKGEVISSNHHLARIIHSKTWKTRLRKMIERAA